MTSSKALFGGCPFHTGFRERGRSPGVQEANLENNEREVEAGSKICKAFSTGSSLPSLGRLRMRNVGEVGDLSISGGKEMFHIQSTRYFAFIFASPQAEAAYIAVGTNFRCCGRDRRRKAVPGKVTNDFGSFVRPRC